MDNLLQSMQTSQSPPFKACAPDLFYLYFRRQPGGFLIGFKQHVEYQGKDCERRDQADHIHCAGESGSDLEDHKRHRIGEQALVPDREPRPLGGVHLALNRADCRKAGGAKQVEREEGISAQHGKGRRNIAVHGSGRAVEYAHRADNVLFGDQPGDRSHRRLPGAPAERREDPGDGVADRGEDRGTDLIFRQHPECAVHYAEEAEEPDQNGRKQNNGAGLFNEGPAALPHGAEHVADSRQVIRGQFHYKGRGVACEHLGFLQHDTGNDNAGHAEEIRGSRNPGGTAEDRAGDHGDKGDFRAAWNKCSRHNGHAAVPLVFNGSGRHNTGHAAARTDQDGDERFA